MEIAVFSDYLGLGGQQAVIADQIRVLRHLGHECHLLGPRRAEGTWNPGLHTTRIEVPGSGSNFIGMARARAEYVAHMRMLKPAVAIVHGIRTCILDSTTVLTHKRIYVNHGELPYSSGRRLAFKLAPVRASLAISNTPAKGTRWKYARAFSPSLQGSVPLANHLAARRSTIGWFARLDAPKRLDVWLRIFDAVYKKAEVNGIVFGRGSLSSQLKNANQQVVVAESATPSEAFGIIGILLAWSDSEGQFPLAAQEAIWYGVPVIINRLPGIEAFLGATMVGLVDSPKEATDLIIRMQDPKFFSHVITQQQNRLKEMMKRPSMNDLIINFVREMQ